MRCSHAYQPTANHPLSHPIINVFPKNTNGANDKIEQKSPGYLGPSGRPTATSAIPSRVRDRTITLRRLLIEDPASLPTAPLVALRPFPIQRAQCVQAFLLKSRQSASSPPFSAALLSLPLLLPSPHHPGSRYTFLLSLLPSISHSLARLSFLFHFYQATISPRSFISSNRTSWPDEVRCSSHLQSSVVSSQLSYPLLLYRTGGVLSLPNSCCYCCDYPSSYSGWRYGTNGNLGSCRQPNWN